MPPRKNDALMEMEMTEWDFTTRMPENFFYLVFGKRRSGKTTMMRLISQVLPFAFTYQHVVIAGSVAIRKLWAKIVHDFYIHDGSDETNILRVIIDEMQRRCRVCEHYNVPFPPEWELALYIDDCGSYAKFMHSKEMNWIASQGRNSHITIFIMVQKLTQASTECREGADGVMVLYSAFQDSIKALHKEFASCIKFDQFSNIHACCTQRKGMLVVDANAEVPTAAGIFGFSHADVLHPDGFKAELKKVGHPDHWAYAVENYKLPPAPKLNLGEGVIIVQAAGESGNTQTANVNTPLKQKRASGSDSDSSDLDQPFQNSAIIPRTSAFQDTSSRVGNLMIRFKRRLNTAKIGA